MMTYSELAAPVFMLRPGPDWDRCGANMVGDPCFLLWNAGS